MSRLPSITLSEVTAWQMDEESRVPRRGPKGPMITTGNVEELTARLALEMATTAQAAVQVGPVEPEPVEAPAVESPRRPRPAIKKAAPRARSTRARKTKAE